MLLTILVHDRRSLSDRDLDQGADQLGSSTRLLHCGEEQRPGSGSSPALSFDLTRNKLAPERQKMKRTNVGVSTETASWVFLSFEKLIFRALLICRRGNVHMSKCIAAHDLLNGNRRLGINCEE